MNKTKLLILLIVLISIPTFFRMLKFGIYSMQDPHLFRLFEFDKCVKDFQIPCRWAPDSGLGYGEPLFNFYGQTSYAVGEIFHLIGFQIPDSLKITFILSLAGSGLAMFFLAKKIWKNNLAGLLSAVIYLYAPYRAVDVWVRGALPEALSFVLFPLIFLSFISFVENKKIKTLLIFSILMALLIVTHNLSYFMFLPFLASIIVYELISHKEIKLLGKITLAFILSALLSAFYLLPVIFESKYINLQSTTLGYFNFRGHFTTLFQILFSRFWGYGASLFGPEDGLNLSVGLIQWLLPILIIIYLTLKRNLKKNYHLLFFVLLGWLALFLTHNKSTFIWELVKPMAFIQFPWRFLSVAVFFFALASGSLIQIKVSFVKYLLFLVMIIVLLLNFKFFREDIWYPINDRELLQSNWWNDQKATSLPDYWPIFGPLPNGLAPNNFAYTNLVYKSSNKESFDLTRYDNLKYKFPIAYFPGWRAYVGYKELDIYPTNDGLIGVNLVSFENNINFVFKNTTIRTLANIISFSTLIAIFIFLLKKKNEK